MPFLRRVFGVALLLLGAATIVFFLIHLIPGDPVAVMLGEGAAPSDVEAMRHALGLDRPLLAQYGAFLNGLFHGDLGTSLHSKEKVTVSLLRAIPATASLALFAFAASVLIAVPTGFVSAVLRGSRVDSFLRIVSLAGVSTPNYVSGPILVLVFSISLGLLPVSGRTAPGSLILPGVTLGLALAALLSRMVRASVAEELGKPYVLAARSRGEGVWGSAFRHAFRNALPPILVVAGLQFGSLLTGAVVTETLFSWPGVGRYLIQSIQRRDYPAVQGCVLFIATVYVLVNAFVDGLAATLDPRARARTAT